MKLIVLVFKLKFYFINTSFYKSISNGWPAGQNGGERGRRASGPACSGSPAGHVSQASSRARAGPLIFFGNLSPQNDVVLGERFCFFFLGWFWAGGGGKASKWADFFIFFWAGKWERAVGLFPLNVFFFFVFMFIFL